MKIIDQINAATRVLDLFNADKHQFVFMSKKEYIKKYGDDVLDARFEPNYFYEHLGVRNQIPLLGIKSINGYWFYFIDPKNIKLR